MPTHEVDELLLLSWWFRHRQAELGRTVPARALLAAADDATLVDSLADALRTGRGATLASADAA